MSKQSVGIVKEIDNLGRICIPKELRNLFGIDQNVELVVTTEGILIRNPMYRLVRRTRIQKSTQEVKK